MRKYSLAQTLPYRRHGILVQLTREEEEILKGKHGEAMAKALEVIVKIAEKLDAPRLVKIRHAHISGVSYGTIGEPGAKFLEELAEQGAKFSVPASVNPIGFDRDYPDTPVLRVSRDFIRGQTRILNALRKMGADLLLTCTPYYTDSFDRYGLKLGDSVAWGESSAVVYGNSVLGVRTNREGGPLALLAGIAGRTYYYGLHDPNNRIPRTGYKVLYKPVDEAVLGVVAEIIARVHEDEYPPLLLTEEPITSDTLVRELGAALGAAGNIPMMVIPGITKEAETARSYRTIEIRENEISSRLKELEPEENPDIIFIGCPHMSLEELKLLSERGRRASRSRIVLTMSRSVFLKALKLGIVDKLRKLNYEIIRDTCLIVSNLSSRDVSIATNSYKAYFYLSRRVRSIGLTSIVKLIEMIS